MTEKVIELKRQAGSSSNGVLLQCHLMPCKIDYNKPTVKAKEYFWPTIQVLRKGGDEEQGRIKSDDSHAPENSPENPIYTASFRGRPLQGRKIKLPEDYKGCIVPKEAKMANNGSSNEFNEFTYWNWDELPSDNDAVVKALQWINISKAIHASNSAKCVIHKF